MYPAPGSILGSRDMKDPHINLKYYFKFIWGFFCLNKEVKSTARKREGKSAKIGKKELYRKSVSTG